MARSSIRSTLHAQAWKEALERFGKQPSFADVRSQIGKGADQLMPVFLSRDELSRFAESLQTFRGEHFKREYLQKVRAFPRARYLLLRVREAGKRIALASSAADDELGHYVEVAQIGDLIDYTTSADDVARSKPCPDVFCAALTGLQVSAEDAIVVGDSPYDVQAAARAGLRTVGCAVDLPARDWSRQVQSRSTTILPTYTRTSPARLLLEGNVTAAGR